MFLKQVIDCSRCGGSHEDITAKRLTKPIRDPGGRVIYTHWVPCPTNGEPILVVEMGKTLSGEFQTT